MHLQINAPCQKKKPEKLDDFIIIAVFAALIFVVIAASTHISPVDFLFPASMEKREHKAAQAVLNEPINVYANRPTRLLVWDDGAEDGDVVEINGIVVNLRRYAKSILINPGTITVRVISEGQYPPCTAAVRSEVDGSVTHIGGTVGTYRVPVNYR